MHYVSRYLIHLIQLFHFLVQNLMRSTNWICMLGHANSLKTSLAATPLFSAITKFNGREKTTPLCSNFWGIDRTNSNFILSCHGKAKGKNQGVIEKWQVPVFCGYFLLSFYVLRKDHVCWKSKYLPIVWICKVCVLFVLFLLCVFILISCHSNKILR